VPRLALGLAGPATQQRQWCNASTTVVECSGRGGEVGGGGGGIELGVSGCRGGAVATITDGRRR
jgi:hypothetical protein